MQQNSYDKQQITLHLTQRLHFMVIYLNISNKCVYISKTGNCRRLDMIMGLP